MSVYFVTGFVVVEGDCQVEVSQGLVKRSENAAARLYRLNPGFDILGGGKMKEVSKGMGIGANNLTK